MEAEKEKLDRMLSRSNFFLGQARWLESRNVEAAALLDAVRPDDRGFEWGYVKRQLSGNSVTLYGHTGFITAAAFSPDGRRVASASDDGTVRVWDAATGAELNILRGHADTVRSVAFSPDGRRVASASDDKTVRVWDAATGAELTALCGHTEAVSSAAFSPDGRRVASASDDGTVRVWDAATGAELTILRGHADSVRSAAFSPDGRRVVSAGHDKTIRVWDASGGAELVTLRGHVDGVFSAAFRPDGRRLVSRDFSGTVKQWEVATGREVAEPPTFPVSDDARRYGHVLAVPQGNEIVLVDTRLPDEWALGQRRFHARVNPWWHREQADAAEYAKDAFAVAFHRGWVATAWPDDADAWAKLDGACRRAGSPRQLLAACDRVLDANPDNADARRRRALYRGSAAAAVAGFAAGWPGLAPLADW